MRNALHAQQGIALIAVLAFLAVMSLIAMGVVSAARTSVSGASRHLARAQAQAAIESAIDVAASTLAEARGTAPPILSTPKLFEIAGFRVKVTVRAERAKIDLNFADAELLAALFHAAGADRDKAQALAAAIEDWRDGDELVHLNGAEKRQYAEAGFNYEPANRLFATIGELQFVLGMDQKLFACVRPQLTTLTQAPGIQVESASPMIRRELGLDQATSAGAAVVVDQLITPGDVYEITAELDDQKRNLRRAERVSVRITGNPADPFWVLDIEPSAPIDDAARRACPKRESR